MPLLYKSNPNIASSKPSLPQLYNFLEKSSEDDITKSLQNSAFNTVERRGSPKIKRINNDDSYRHSSPIKPNILPPVIIKVKKIRSKF